MRPRAAAMCALIGMADRFSNTAEPWARHGYGSLSPFYDTHPHFLLMENWQFALWPLWMKYDVAADVRNPCPVESEDVGLVSSNARK